MIRVIVFVVILVVSAVLEEAKCEPSTPEGAQGDYYLGSGDGQSKISQNYKEREPILSEEENKIVQDVFSPDYYEPNIILDYRYLKTGGRGYARSDGGQILILPKRNHMPNSHNNYDTLIEYLRLKHQHEMNKYWRIDLDGTSKGHSSHLYEDSKLGEGVSYKPDTDKEWAAYIR